MADLLTTVDEQSLVLRFGSTRRLTDQLAAPLSAEDQTVQSMPDVSPTKWHRAHTSWFFETFLLVPSLDGYPIFHPEFGYLFNSYYVGVGDRYPRADRGLVSRPGIVEVADYRRHVDVQMAECSCTRGSTPRSPPSSSWASNMSSNTRSCCSWTSSTSSRRTRCCPSTCRCTCPGRNRRAPTTLDGTPRWHPVEIGHAGGGFGFDNEFPRHRVHLEPFALADRTVTCGEWIDFIDDGGYRRPELWLSDGWATVEADGWEAPLYWEDRDGGWREFTLAGEVPVDPSRPVCHVSYYEADAFARWAGLRLPTEAEWEVVSTARLADAARRPPPRHGSSSTRPPLPGGSAATVRATSGSGPPRPTAPTRGSPRPRRRRRVQRQVHGQPVRAAGRLVRRPRPATSDPPTGTSSRRRPAGPSPGCGWPVTPDAGSRDGTVRYTVPRPHRSPWTPSSPRPSKCTSRRPTCGPPWRPTSAPAWRPSPKELPPVYFYDDRGSRLFDEITRLPEYYPTRAERSILEAHAKDMVRVRRRRRPGGAGSRAPATSRGSCSTPCGQRVASGRTCRWTSATPRCGRRRPRCPRYYPGLAVRAVVGDFHQPPGPPGRSGPAADRLPGRDHRQLRSGRQRTAFLAGLVDTHAPR